MNKVHHSLSIICLFIFFTSCSEKDADVKLPVIEPKLVIMSFISPQDSIVKVEVSLSQPLYNNANSQDHSPISNATVQINNGTNTKTLTYNAIENYYEVSASQFPIVAGTTYYLTVSTPDGKNVNASTWVPTANSTLTFSSRIINDPSQSNAFIIESSWNDPAGSEDYYRISYYSQDTCSGCLDTTYTHLVSDNFSDKENNGSIFNKNMQVNKKLGKSGYLFLIHATKEYYLYHTKLNMVAIDQGPFSESVQMYSNIQGGYGIFSGFNQYKVLVVP